MEGRIQIAVLPLALIATLPFPVRAHWRYFSNRCALGAFDIRLWFRPAFAGMESSFIQRVIRFLACWRTKPLHEIATGTPGG
jgi:hypothetical protein